MSSSVSDINRLINPSPENDPFLALMIDTRKIINPSFPQWALNCLITFTIMRILLILSCLIIIITPFFRGPISRKKNLFLFNKIYSQSGNGIPYFVPNRCLIISVCELFSSVLYVFSAVGNYRLYSGSEPVHGPIGYICTWFGLEWLPAFLGIWLSSWSLVHACLCDVKGDNQNQRFSKLLTPLLYNSIWLTVSLVVIMLTTYWALRTTQILIIISPVKEHLFDLLQTSIKSWSINHDLKQIPTVELFSEGDFLHQYLEKLSPIIVAWAQTWLAFAIVLTAFYLFIVSVLLRMLRQVLHIRDSEAMSIQAQSSIWKELEDEFWFLSRSSVIVALSLGTQILVMVFQSISSTHPQDIDWRMGSAIVCQIPGVFMVPAQLLQSRRILFEKIAIDDSKFNTVPLDFQTNPIPKLTSQLLGWDTTICRAKEPSMDSLNFPGLLEIKSDPINDDKEISNLESVESTCTSDFKDPVEIEIKVVRSTTTVTQE
ncbi:uncharacterized protein MELLADRAFT_70812 [Melampsora larici-populina 98AG31]|uniref:Uncharacterized protein n=1 Tax=Melampsora larici-populina (strain 98AG31 / pathotype 3-4-7) TaxID=747676 RepID=F4R868_MELLP|nr:uncharacterized protein MELLADRAFT_70812 [Melampsora larici-populina 98AG31]EGG11667.1 hypothetical protein MELLADRAFT_70812 [Melampsora larici-populina 98AG31]